MRTLVALLLLVAAGACGGGSANSSRDAAAAVWHDYVVCVRAHGVPDMPEATLDDQGRADFPSSAPSVPDAAVRTCGARVASLPTRSATRPDVAALTRFARCMRAQGIADWPDPGADGRFTLPPDLQVKSGVRWPQVDAAWNGPCRQYDPSGQLPLSS